MLVDQKRYNLSLPNLSTWTSPAQRGLLARWDFDAPEVDPDVAACTVRGARGIGRRPGGKARRHDGPGARRYGEDGVRGRGDRVKHYDGPRQLVGTSAPSFFALFSVASLTSFKTSSNADRPDGRKHAGREGQAQAA